MQIKNGNKYDVNLGGGIKTAKIVEKTITNTI